MSESEYYRVLFEENIFALTSYDLGSIPRKITFGEFVFEFVENKETNIGSYVIVSYYKDDDNMPEELLLSIKNKYVTKECGISSSLQCVTKETITKPSHSLYITRRIGLIVFIREMKCYFNRVYNKNSVRKR